MVRSRTPSGYARGKNPNSHKNLSGGCKLTYLSIEPIEWRIRAGGGIAKILTSKGMASRSREFERLRRMWEHAQEVGRLTTKAADTLAIDVFEMHPLNIWGEEWWTGLPPLPEELSA